MSPMDSPRDCFAAASCSFDFDAVLLDVSNLLADARTLERQNRSARAAVLYEAAERCALAAGYLELLHLVWAYAPPTPAPR